LAQGFDELAAAERELDQLHQRGIELEATRGKSTRYDVTEAEIFAKSIGELEAERGEVTTKEILEAKIFAKCFARAIAKVSAEQDAAISAQEPYRVANHRPPKAFALPRYCLA
jgi:hypothetical protein